VKESKEMSTVAIVNNSPAGKSGGEAAEQHSAFQVYKPGEGYTTRLGMMAVLMAYVGFACHHWYFNWSSVRDFFEHMFSFSSTLAILTDWTYNTKAGNLIASIGTLLLVVAGFLSAYYYIYIKRSTADFLIKTDLELSKVTWPKISPWFRADTQVWGATYVVLLVIAGLTLYIAGVDLVLRVITDFLFYTKHH
jgi:preprotein translocase subunit SecE